jgi:hypothetical protein
VPQVANRVGDRVAYPERRPGGWSRTRWLLVAAVAIAIAVAIVLVVVYSGGGGGEGGGGY